MKFTGNMGLFLLVFMAPAILPKPLLSSMEKAMKPAEPANGTGRPKGLPLVSQTLIMQSSETNRLIFAALIQCFGEDSRQVKHFSFLKHKYLLIVVPPSLPSNTGAFAALASSFCLMLLNICALIQQVSHTARLFIVKN